MRSSKIVVAACVTLCVSAPFLTPPATAESSPEFQPAGVHMPAPGFRVISAGGSGCKTRPAITYSPDRGAVTLTFGDFQTSAEGRRSSTVDCKIVGRFTPKSGEQVSLSGFTMRGNYSLRGTTSNVAVKTLLEGRRFRFGSPEGGYSVAYSEGAWAPSSSNESEGDDFQWSPRADIPTWGHCGEPVEFTMNMSAKAASGAMHDWARVAVDSNDSAANTIGVDVQSCK